MECLNARKILIICSSRSQNRYAQREKFYCPSQHTRILAGLMRWRSALLCRDTLWLTPYLKRLKEDPGFKMDIEQTSIIAEYLHRHPEKKAEIQKGLDDGRILIGATYTQPYEELFSGESLIRQLYLGKKWLADNFNGYESDTYYNSDVPGRTLQMSQILAKSGVNNMFVSRHEKGVYRLVQS